MLVYIFSDISLITKKFCIYKIDVQNFIVINLDSFKL